MKILYYLLCTVQLLFAVGLVVIISIQESKNEGLTGQIGTATTTSFKGKAGKEERLNQITRNMAFAFFALSALVAVTTNRWGP